MKLIFTILLGLMLSSCATFTSKQINASISHEVETFDAPASWAINTHSDEKVASDWSGILVDERLFELIEEALSNNPSLQSSAESIIQSEALLKQAKSAYYPTLTASLSPAAGTTLRSGNLTDSYSSALGASWEADLWGRIRSNAQAVKYDKFAAEQFYISAREALIAQVIRAYIFAIENKQQQAINDRTLKDQEETLRIVRKRFELGAVSKRELVLAESDVYLALDNLRVTEATLTASIQGLQLLLGQYPDADLIIPEDFPQAEKVVAAGSPLELLRRRPDILQAEFQVRSAFEQEKVIKKGRWPTLAISSDLASSVGNALNLLNPTDLALSLGGSLADTLFDAGLSEGRIEVAESVRRAQLKLYGQAVLESFADVEGRLNDLELIDIRYELSQKASEAAGETLRLSEIQYREGTLDLIDVITFRQRSLQAERTLLTIERQKIEARVALYLALGGTADGATLSP